jgi:hypothetical protein
LKEERLLIAIKCASIPWLTHRATTAQLIGPSLCLYPSGNFSFAAKVIAFSVARFFIVLPIPSINLPGEVHANRASTLYVDRRIQSPALANHFSITTFVIRLLL